MSPSWGTDARLPDLHVTGETAESVVASLQSTVDSAVRGEDPLRLAFLLERVKTELLAEPSARAALDMALL